MIREYMQQNVYEALQERLRFIFEEFDNVYVSFSGGKDSGLLLNLVMDYRRKYYPWKTIGIFHQDFEAQYTVTTEYVERTLEHYKDEAELYWVCRVFNTCKWNNMAETAELRLFLCQVYKNLMLYGVVFHVKQWYNGGYETLV